jgi:pantoate--beta-alanine ligase
MGAIHNGHKELIKTASINDSTVITSIFVNPIQFGPNEDLDNYPRRVDSDLEKLKDLEVDAVFLPSPEEIYPNNFSTSINVGSISSVLEGRSRPEHFNGVATIVCKLLLIINPDHAYFGEKDAQQCLVIEKMVHDLNIRTKILKVPTVRETDGLAISSRNMYLSKPERDSATIIYKSLSLARELHSQGIKNASFIKNSMSELINSVPFTKQDYISISEPSTLKELDLIDCDALISVAVFVGKTRLIDNIFLKSTD